MRGLRGVVLLLWQQIVAVALPNIFFSVGVITEGTTEYVSNNVKKNPFSRHNTTLNNFIDYKFGLTRMRM